MSDAERVASARRAAVFRDLALDGLALRTIDALQQADIDVLLMKGPVTRWWLYGGREREYTDVDLLVSPASERAADSVMRALGFQDLHALDLNLYKPPSERAWLAPEGVVDLHVGLVGVPAERWSTAWARFASEGEPFVLRERTVRIMDAGSRALHLALHAAQKASGTKARRDLEIACRSVAPSVWARAGVIAGELDAQAAFVAGLRSIEDGAGVLAELDLPPTRSTTLTTLHLRGAPAEALALARLGDVPPRKRIGTVLGWFRFEEESVSDLRAWRLRAAALSRFPSALWAWFTAGRATQAEHR